MKKRIVSLNKFVSVNETSEPDEVVAAIPKWVSEIKKKYPKTDVKKMTKELLSVSITIQNTNGIWFDVGEYWRASFRNLWLLCYDYEIDGEWLQKYINKDAEKFNGD